MRRLALVLSVALLALPPAAGRRGRMRSRARAPGVALVALRPAAPADGPVAGAGAAPVDQLWSPDDGADSVVAQEPTTTLVQARDAETRAVLPELVQHGP